MNLFNVQSLYYIAGEIFLNICLGRGAHFTSATENQSVPAASPEVIDFFSLISFGKFTCSYHGLVLLSYHVHHFKLTYPFL